MMYDILYIMYIYDIIWFPQLDSSICCHFGISSGQRACSPLGLRKMMGSCTARQKMRSFAAHLSGGVWGEADAPSRKLEMRLLPVLGQ